MKKHALRLLMAACALLLTACDAEDLVSREYTCRFSFSYNDHPTSLLFTAVKNPGTYVYVTTSGDGKTATRHVYVTSNDGKTPKEDNIIRTAPENYASYLLGASNDIGIIVGCTNFNGTWAYDRCCPNCAGTKAMNWTGNRQQVACGKCGRTYDLETGNVISGDEGRALLRYYCSFDGSMLRAWN